MPDAVVSVGRRNRGGFVGSHCARVAGHHTAPEAGLRFAAGIGGGGLKAYPGEWLRERLVDRVLQAVLFGTMGAGWLLGAGNVLWVTRGAGRMLPEGAVWSMLLPAAVFLGVAVFKAVRGWRLGDMLKGTRAEEKVGQAVECALTSAGCAVAHHVERIAEIGDIDHLVATPHGLWVIETKHGRVPKPEFPGALQRIARNVAAVRKWAPGLRVTGCLVFAHEPEKPPKPYYMSGAEKILCFASPRLLMIKLKDEAHAEGGSSRIAKKVWPLAKL